MLATDTERDWATLAVTSTLLPAADRVTAEEVAAEASHLTAVYREPGGEWEPVRTGEAPTRYVFLIDGVMHAGTLDDYAAAWVATHYIDATLDPRVRTWAGAEFPVRIVHTDTADDYLAYRISVGEESVDVHLFDQH